MTWTVAFVVDTSPRTAFAASPTVGTGGSEGLVMAVTPPPAGTWPATRRRSR